MQKAYVTALYELLQRDRNVISCLSDSGTDYDELIAREFPQQIVNFGICENTQLSAAAGLAAGEVVKSPMPGNILKINVSAGQKVNEGDVLIVLEAMKMENEITATKAGTVAQVAVTKGQVVETGSPLVVIA